MIVNFNISPALFERLVTAIERLAADYADVHGAQLRLMRDTVDVSKEVGRTFYQSDRAIWNAEQEAKRKRAEELGEEEDV